jgi:long-chain acyl-CoA synthetase
MSKRPFAWEKSYPPGLSWDAPIKVTTLGALFDSAVAKYADNSAIDYAGRTISYRELGAEAAAAGSAFLHAGMDRDTTLALYLPNCPDFAVAFFGAAKAGLRLVPLSPLDAERELAYKLADSGARTLVTTDIAPLFQMALKLLDAGHIDRLIVGENARWTKAPIPTLPIPERDDVIAWSAFVEGVTSTKEWPTVSPQDVLLLQYTGGTTGLPKGAMLTHANLSAAVSMYWQWYEPQDLNRAGGDDKVICVLPLFHIYALTTILLRQIQLGNQLLLRLRFDVEQILNDIEVQKATVFPGVPTMWIALSHAPGLEKRDLSSLRFCGSGGAPLPVEVGKRFERLTGLPLRGGWGMTETAPAGTNLPHDMKDKPGTIGLPLPGIEMDVAALDDPTRVLPPGEVGEIRIRGANVTAGYWQRPAETKAAFADGYFLTGDIGTMDEDGYFFIVDRKKDMILSGGFNVYPQMVEQAIYEHPSIEEVLVVGIPDAYRGESAKAFVKLRDGAPRLTLDELREFLTDKVGRHEMPRDLEIRDALPRTAVGKLSKVALREEVMTMAKAAATA